VTTNAFRAALDRQLAQHRELGIRPNVIDSVEVYFELLRRWNRRINLTALDVEGYGTEALDRLLLEPLLSVRHVSHRLTHWIDLGSGGGSPALPMRMILTSGTQAMVESRGRKVAFLREAVRLLGLDRTVVIQSRFETLADVRRADLITLRAVKIDSAVIEAIDNLLAPGGRVALFGSSEPAINLGSLRLETRVPLLPTSWLAVYAGW